MSSTDPATTFLTHVDEDRPWAATRMGLDLLADAGPVAMIDELLVPVQREAGRRWQTRQYSVADEHEVTALVDELLGATSADLGRSPDAEPAVTLVCAEGEWHASAARMITLLLRARQWDVRYLGASTPPAELEQHLRRRPPDALLISCTMSSALAGAAAMAEVAHRVGVPVIVGGAAPTRIRSAGDAVGADAVAATPEEAGELLRTWRGRRPPPANAARDRDPGGERSALREARRHLVRAVVEGTTGPFRPEDEAEVDGLLATLDAALLVDDVAVLAHHIEWLADRERAEQVLPVPLAVVVDQLVRSMPTGLRTSRDYLADAAGPLRCA